MRCLRPNMMLRRWPACATSTYFYNGRALFSTRPSGGQHVDPKTESVEQSRSTHTSPSYLDMQATTPVDPRVVDSMLPFWHLRYGSPHSRSHVYGWDADDAVENARKQVAKIINASEKEIIFTSGATESNNLAVKGIAKFYGKQKKHIITTQVEHKCVLASCRELEQDGFETTYLPTDENGLISLKALEEAIRPDTALVSVMMVNNEIGTIQDVKAIGELCRAKGVFFHTDAAQAIGKIPVDVEDMKIDLMSISGHKLYGPKGVGAIYVRRKPRVRLRPIIDGGGQERGMRSGTLSTPLCVGLGHACEVAMEEMENDKKHITDLSEHMTQQLTERVPEIKLNGHPKYRYIGNLNYSFSCVEGESLLMALAKDISVSSGSACTSASLEPSYVLRAIGVDEELAHTSLRFGIGRFTTKEEIDKAVEVLIKEVQRLRDMSPLWELHLEGADEGHKGKVKWS